jgi:hypothetical protein
MTTRDARESARRSGIHRPRSSVAVARSRRQRLRSVMARVAAVITAMPWNTTPTAKKVFAEGGLLPAV